MTSCAGIRFQSLLYWIGRGDALLSGANGWRRKCFNPCCIGLGVGTSSLTFSTLTRERFQSLLYWIGRGDMYFRQKKDGTIGFQSLLYWIGRGDWSQNFILDLVAEVSILVVLDWAWGRALIGATEPEEGCFNPCCIGLGVGTEPRPDGRLLMTLPFQSLLYWIGRGDLSSSPPPATARRFQSLLYWIGRGDNIGNPSQMNTARFQSLLYWIGRGDHVECAKGACLAWCFNPCCIGLGVGTVRAKRSHCRTLQCFNPCCIGLGVGTYLLCLFLG